VKAIRGSYREQAITDADLRHIYRRAACVVIPLADKDSSPVGQSVCLQAMSCGKPVVMTKTRATWSDALRDGENIIFVPPNDPDALAQAANRLLADPSLRARMGDAGRDTVLRHFQIRSFSSDVVRACERAIADMRAPSVSSSGRRLGSTT
jgi:glycosyltransferase involved in cell wall biosynthesis